MRTFGIFVMAVALVAACQSDVSAQATDGPLAAVEKLFLGMRMANVSIVRETLAPDVRIAAVAGVGGSARIEAQDIEGFLRSIGVSQGAWNEQIYDVEVRSDDTMASVWAPFTFYLNGRLSHCGVNSIELLQDAEGWKITQISDTRRTAGCPDPLGA